MESRALFRSREIVDDSDVPAGRSTPGSVERTLEILDQAELTQELEKRRMAARRHGLWAVLGLSPAAIVPFIATAHEFGIAAASACTIFVSGMEAWRAIQAHMDAKEYEAKMALTIRAGETVASSTGSAVDVQGEG